MKHRLSVILVPGVLLPALLLATGCDNKKAEITPEKKAQFGTYNQPMPAGIAEKIRAGNEKAAASRANATTGK